MRSLLVRGRLVVLEAADRSPLARVLLAGATRRYLSRRGPLDTIADEAIAEARTREAKRTAEMLMWSAAVAGEARFPRWFPAAHHIQSPEGRRRSAEALHDHLQQDPDAPGHLWRQYFLLTEPDDLDEMRTFVRTDLDTRLRSSSRRAAADRVAIPTSRQMDILRRAVESLEAAGIRPFLVSGTLLGCVRDGRLMDHDYDIDLGVLPGEADADEIAWVLASAGFEVKAQDLKVVGRDESDFAVDVFLHYERDGLLWHGTEIHEWWNTSFGLERFDLQGVPVWIPDNAATYLKENYGRWDRPVAFYHFSFDTPNRRYRPTYQALLYLHRRLLLALDAGDRWVVESAARELRDNFGVDVTSTLQPTGLLRPSDAPPETP